MEPSFWGGAAGRYLRRAQFEVWRSLEPRYPVHMQGRALTVPGAVPNASRLPASWPGNWKTQLFARLLDGRLGAFLDVGANTGQTLLDHFSLNSQTHYLGFEPNPICAAILKEIIRANALEDHAIVPVGLSDDNALVKLYVRGGKSADGSGTLMAQLRPHRTLEAHYAPCYRLDDIAGALGLGEIPLIKIDVEGAELLALRGMRETVNAARPWIVCEVLHRDADADAAAHAARNAEILDLLADLGYGAHRILKPANESRLDGFMPITAFSNETWTPNNKHECDYLFAPREAEDQLTR
ncbi:MAG TPA: FkbM family methyltransferase [Caulobacterales bacterium]|nr:FkbM family methyltransferase [Caulobacterales bacterium]